MIPVILSSLIAAGSCSHKRAVTTSRRTDSTLIATEVRYVEKLRDSTVYIQFPAEFREVVRQDSSLLETALAVSRARIDSGGHLWHTLENKPSPYPAAVQLKDRSETKVEKEIVVQWERVEVPVEKPVGGWRKFLQYSGLLFWGAALGYAMFVILRLVM